MSQEDLVRSTIRFPKALHSSLKREAADQGRSIEELVRSAVERELSGPIQGRFADVPRGNERRLLRELEKQLHTHLEKIRDTLATPEANGHDFLMMVADQFVDCLPIPMLIRTKDGDGSWKNAAFCQTFDESDEEQNLEKIDHLDAGRRDGYCLVDLKVKRVEGVPEDINFDSWQFSFWDSDDKACTGDLLLPHAAVENAIRGQSVLLPIPERPPDGSHVDAIVRRALVARQARFLESLPVAVAIKDLRGRYQWANNFLLGSIAHKNLEEIVGKKPGELFQLDSASSVDEQEELVKSQKIGLIASAAVNPGLTRTGLRFPLLDSQQRITHVGALGTGPAIAIRHRHAEQTADNADEEATT